MKRLILLFTILFSSNLFADSVCEFNHGTYLNTHIQTGAYQDGTCFVSITNAKNYNLVYRAHLFTSKGQHQIFNSFGPGPSSTETGARIFFYLIKNPKLTLKFYQSDIEISYGANLQILFDADTATLSDKSVGIKFDESSSVNRLNAGGVEVKQYSGKFIDFGFELGSSPQSNLSREHTIIRADGVKCTVINSKLLTIKNYDIFWKYSGYRALSKYFDEVCPAI